MNLISIFDLSHAEIEEIIEKGKALKTENAREGLKTFLERRK
jgi:aspartate carbamoyltransferase catalytic subunit